jgi:xylulokinase
MSIICCPFEQTLTPWPERLVAEFWLARPRIPSIEFANAESWFLPLRILRRMNKDLLLAFDIGTSSVRAALVNQTGKILAFAAKELDQVIPRSGWSQQSPRSWWEGLVFSIRSVLPRVTQSADRIAAIAGCGQMHGTVLVDDTGELVLEEVPLWNDKRTRELVERFSAEQDAETLRSIAANPPTVAWPAFKLAWIKQNLPKAYEASRTVLMPKDYINFKLTGERGIDLSEASSSYLFDFQTSEWSEKLLRLFNLDPAKLPNIGQATQLLGTVTEEAAESTGLRTGTPVAMGAGDFPVSLLGAGVIRPDIGCDITGTSTVITMLTERPATDQMISNVRAIAGGWAAFTIVDASGDAVRWVRRAFQQRETPSYDQIMSLAAGIPAGSDRLLFLPYLNGERIADQPNSRAQFFGLTNEHQAAHLYRAVLEGVAFAAKKNIELMKARGCRLDRMVTAAGGAKTRLWLEIKASVYNAPILVPSEPECGVLGCAILAGLAAGFYSDVRSAVTSLVRYDGEVLPNPAWLERYQAMQSLFNDLYRNSEKFWDRLGTLV